MKYDSVLDQQSISGKIVSLILCVWKPCYVKSGHILSNLPLSSSVDLLWPISSVGRICFLLHVTTKNLLLITVARLNISNFLYTELSSMGQPMQDCYISNSIWPVSIKWSNRYDDQLVCNLLLYNSIGICMSVNFY